MHGRIGFFGLPLGALTLLSAGHELGFAALSPVAQLGRRRLLRRLGEKQVIEVDQPDFDGRVARALDTGSIDLIVSWFWTRRIHQAWISKARLGAIGVHPSLLPKYRGPNPFFAAIDAGDVVTGVTAHELTSEYDTGRILLQCKVPLGESNSWQLARALDRPSLRLLAEATAGVLTGSLHARDQEEALASWAPEPTGTALLVDWSWPTERILRRIRALAPVPGLALDIKGCAFFVTRARRVARPKLELRAGEAVIWGEPSSVVIATADGAIQVDECVLGEGAGDEVGEVLRGPDFAAHVGPL
ncbi:MAG: formyltransferase family protein [Polyangiaceae bacterium]|nr:formyltransferase family protein [Polyangiaceae bacterium]